VPNLEQPEQAPSSGQVVLTQAQYDELKRKAGEPSAQPDPTVPKKKIEWGFLLVLLFLLSFVVPVFGWLIFILPVFGVMAVFGIFRDARFNSHGATRANPLVLIFKIVASVVIGAILVIGCFVAFIMLLFAANPDARGS
jgi:cytochrome b561